MTEIQLPYLPSAQFFKIFCRLGINEQDVIGDSDGNPQIRTIGGTVSISAMIPRFRYTEADGRKRVVYTKTETYNIQTSTGELFDADGNIGVNLLNTNSPQMDPQGWTYRATVRPNGGQPFDVFIPSDPEGDVFDLGDGLVFTPSTGITTLETRVKALEDAQGGAPGLPENLDESVQDIVGAMIEGAGGTYNDADGTITLPSGGGGATRGLIITDTSVTTIPAGDAVDNLAAYYNSGASAITVQGTSIAAGAHAVWAWVSGAWTPLASGTGGGGTPTLGVPTCAVDSVTSSSITVSYSTTTPDAASWQYRIDGGATGALDGTSSDEISGLSPLQSGTIEVRYEVGATWSAWSAPVAWQTTAPALAALRLPTSASVAETGDASSGYVYTWSASTDYYSNPKHPIVFLASPTQDMAFTFRPTPGLQVYLAGTGGADPLTALATQAVQAIFHMNFGTGGAFTVYGRPSGSYVSGVTLIRLSRSGAALSIDLSADDGVTWVNHVAINRGYNTEYLHAGFSSGTGTVVDRLRYSATGTPLTSTTPSGPIAIDYGPSGGSIIVPETTGVDYKIGGVTVTGTYVVTTPGATITVLPVPKAGYCLYKDLLAGTGWTFAFNAAAVPDSSTAPAMASVLTSDGFNRADGAPGASDVYAGGTARTWTVNTAGTAIASNALSVTGNGGTIGGWASVPGQQVEWDVVSTGSTFRVKIAADTWLQASATGAVSLWHAHQAANPYNVFTRAPVASIDGTGIAGRWVATVGGFAITILRPASSGPSARIILPYALTGMTSVDFSANTWSSSWRLTTEVGDLLIDNVKIGIPA